MHKYRTHKCSELTKKEAGKTVKLSGWIHRKRDHGNLLFFDLRDHYGLTQCVIENSSNFFKELEKIKPESVVSVEGKVVKRSKDTVNKDLSTGEIEIAISSFKDQLSLRGNIKELDLTGGKGSGGTNKVIITDTRERINYIKNLIQSVDKRPTQVNIAVKFIETSLQSDERLGIDWTQRAQLSGPDFAPDSGVSAVGIGSWQEFAMAKMD